MKKRDARRLQFLGLPSGMPEVIENMSRLQLHFDETKDLYHISRFDYSCHSIMQMLHFGVASFQS